VRIEFDERRRTPPAAGFFVVGDCDDALRLD
jgi:hypothetical protein